MKKYSIKVWETEQDRDTGESFIAEIITNKQEAIEKAEKMYYEALYSAQANRVIYGANLKQNEYGPQQYGQFFFFITGFHGFHVFS